MPKATTKRIGREKRHARIRARVQGTLERPRLSVYKSNRYIHAQVIDDTAGKTIISGSTQEKPKDKKTDAAVWLGGEIAKRAKAKDIKSVVFDRGGFRYTGRIAALAEAARKGGLTF
ncbi:MAG: 50S ribosomal protein L18 [Patescibacteria group bacterium]|nr:50S ribosomal protein L18 [Patescibacteria group bacterium]